jgi:hypothetical protein
MPALVDGYKFEVRKGETSWDAIVRLCQEVDHEAVISEDGRVSIRESRAAALRRLESKATPRLALRSEMTREEFIASLCEEAEVAFDGVS